MPRIHNARRSAYAEKDIAFSALVLARLQKVNQLSLKHKMPVAKAEKLQTSAKLLAGMKEEVKSSELSTSDLFEKCILLQDSLKMALPSFYIPLDCCFDLLKIPCLSNVKWNYADQTKGTCADSDSDASSFEDDEDSDASMEDDYDDEDDSSEDEGSEYVQSSEEAQSTESEGESEDESEEKNKKDEREDPKDNTHAPTVLDIPE